MKRKLLVVFLAAVLCSVVAFAFRKNTASAQPNGKFKAITVVTMRYFAPKGGGDIVFLGYNVQTYKDNQQFIQRQVNAKGEPSFFYSEGNAAYHAYPKLKQTAVVGKAGELRPEDMETLKANARSKEGFKRDANLLGLDVQITEGRKDGFGWRNYFNPRFGNVQWEQEHYNGVEREMVIAVVPGIEEREFLNIPRNHALVKQDQLSK